MKRASADARQRRDELASDLRHLAEEIRPLTDSVESLTILLDHVWQNREEFLDLLNGQAENPNIRCERCDRSQGLTEAVTAGWQELRKENSGFWGTCPPCHAAIKNDRELLPAEILFCTCCNATSETSLAESLRAGWQCIVDDEGNERGNYAGMCPACIEEKERAEESTPEETTETTSEQKMLFH